MLITKGYILLGVGITGLIVLFIFGIIFLVTSGRRRRKFIKVLNKSYESN